MNFSGSKISLISRFEWIISASAGCCHCFCKRKLLRLLSKKTLHSGIELISEFPKEWLILTKILFCRFSYCFCLFGEFAKVFERQVRVAHLHSRVHLQVRGGVFNCQQILTKICLVVFLCWEARKIFTNVKRLLISCVSFTQWNFTLRK